MRRRGFLVSVLGCASAVAGPMAAAQAVAPTQGPGARRPSGASIARADVGEGLSRAVVGASWRGPRDGDPHHAGALEVEWARKAVRILWSAELPTRPHGLTPEPDGGLLVVGVRPGTWIARYDGQGRMVCRVRVDEEPGRARLNGHAVASADGRWLFTTETDPKAGRGRIGVRDRETLAKLDEWDSLGIEPHQLLLDADGQVVIANGGIPRTEGDRKHSLDRMDASLARLDGRTGRPTGHWRLDDPRLSLRHLSWSAGPDSAMARLGVALQAEHDDPERRRVAPVLAVFEGERLTLPASAGDAVGYAGDIAPAADGGFVVSSNQVGRALLWHPGRPERLTTIAQLREAYALAGWDGPHRAGGVLVASAFGVARWHPEATPAMAAWPEPMTLDNHWVLLSAS
ncbi:MAG: hypothetical protein RIS35_3080 [Pseudomonadota bacterium]